MGKQSVKIESANRGITRLKTYGFLCHFFSIGTPDNRIRKRGADLFHGSGYDVVNEYMRSGGEPLDKVDDHGLPHSSKAYEAYGVGQGATIGRRHCHPWL